MKVAPSLIMRINQSLLESEVVVNAFTMNGNPSGVTIAYDLSQNVPLSHDVNETTSSTETSYDAGGLVG